MKNNQIKTSEVKISERTAKLIEAREMVSNAWFFIDELFEEEEGGEDSECKRHSVCTPGYFDKNLKELFQKIHEKLTYCLEDSIIFNREESNKTII